MVAYLTTWKKRITMEAGGYNKEGEDTALPARMDNIDATTLLLVEKKGGDTMKQKIGAMRQFLLNAVSSKDTTTISRIMPLRIIPAKKMIITPLETGALKILNICLQ